MQTLTTIVDRLVDLIINPIILLVFSIGFLWFMWGLVAVLWNLKSGEVTQESKDRIIWGIVGMFIMVTVWGIISLVTNTFGIDQRTATDTSKAGSFNPGIKFGK